MRRRSNSFLILLLFLSAGVGWSYPFREALLKSFYYLNIEEKDLSFEKKYGKQDNFRFRIINDFLDNPLFLYEYTASVYSYLNQNSDLRDIFAHLASDLYGIKIEKKTRKRLDIQKELTDIAEIFQGAFKKLDENEIDSLIKYSISFWVDEDDTLDLKYFKKILEEYGYHVDSVQVDVDKFLDVARKVDIEKVLLSTFRLLSLAELLLNSEIPDTVFNTPWGKVLIGGEGDNTYNLDEYAIILDRSGCDVYITGYKKKFLKKPFLIIIDTQGDDKYISGDFFGPASGFFSLEVIIDSDGNDIYDGSFISLASGIFGAGIIEDQKGNDFYRSRTFSQGAGFFGVGLLIDKEGDDTYRATSSAQAFSSTRGMGILCDYNGDDLYYAGGEYVHHPLLPDQYRSFSQGFSIGIRDHASGGFSFLFDRKGNDTYYGEVYSQGTSYWYSYGALVDLEGNDSYFAAEYAQGAGIHLSCGILIDSTGNDMYFSRFGPSQGEGHDYSVGILVDMEGNDSYTVSGGQGIGLNNSCGIFIDFCGDDYYITREKYGQAGGNWARGSIGIGIFEDLGGKDIYRKGAEATNNAVWIPEVGAVGIDTSWFELPRPSYEVESLKIDFDTLSIENLFRIASLWEVRENKKKVRKAREKLLERVDEALPYIFEKKINTTRTLELRAIKYLCEKKKDKVKPFILEKLGTENDTVLRNLIWLVGIVQDTSLIDTFFKYKNHPDYRVRAQLAVSIGKLKYRKGLAVLYKLLRDENEAVRIRSIEAIGKIGDKESVDTLLSILTKSKIGFVIRASIVKALANIKKGVALKVVKEFEKRRDPVFLEILEKIEPSEDSVYVKSALLKELEREESPMLRGYIYKVLAKYSSPGIKTFFEISGEKETNPFVKKVIHDYLKKEE